MVRRLGAEQYKHPEDAVHQQQAPALMLMFSQHASTVQQRIE